MRAAFFDVDGTITKTHIWQGVMKYFQMKGTRRFIRFWFWLYHSPMFILYKLNIMEQTSFRREWGNHLPWYFRGYSIDEANEIWDWIVEEYLETKWWPDSLALVKKHLSEGDVVVLVSASPAPIIKRIAQKLNIEHVVATDVKIEDGIYTESMDGELCMGEHKVRMTKKYLLDNNLKIDLEDSCVYADSTGDVHLLEMVGIPIATHPDRELELIAQERGWQIING